MKTSKVEKKRGHNLNEIRTLFSHSSIFDILEEKWGFIPILNMRNLRFLRSKWLAEDNMFSHLKI